MWMRSWLALVVCVAFAAVTVFLGVAEPSDRHWVAYSAFWIFGVLLLGTEQLHAWRAKRSETARVQLDEGVTFRPRRARLLALAVPLAIVGGLLFWATPGEGWPIRLASGAMVAAGLALSLLLLSPRPFSDFVRFEPEGLVLGRGHYEVRVPWSEIESLQLDGRAWSIHIEAPRLDRLGIVVPAGGDEAAARAQLARTVQRNRAFVGADLRFTPWRYGLDPGLTMRALEQRLKPLPPDAVRIEVVARYRPHGGSDRLRARLDPAEGGAVWRQRRFDDGRVQEVERTLTLAQTRRVLDELEARHAWQLPEAPPRVMDGLAVSFIFVRGPLKHHVKLEGLDRREQPASLLLDYLLGLAAFPPDVAEPSP